MSLPPSLSLEVLLSREMPGDLSLDEVRRYMMVSGILDGVRSVSRHPDRVQLRFLDVDDQELPDTTTLDELRAKVQAGTARIRIDDMGGGTLVEEPA